MSTDLVKLENQNDTSIVSAHRDEDWAAPPVRGNVSIQESFAAGKYFGTIETLHEIRKDLYSKLILTLMSMEKDKAWRDLGFKSFQDLLDNGELWQGSSSKFYNERELLKEERPELFDFCTDLKLPRTTRKMFIENGIAYYISGDHFFIGDVSVPLTDKKAIRALFNSFKEAMDDRNEKIEKQRKQITERDEIIIGKIVDKDMNKAVRLIAQDPTPLLSGVMELNSAFLKVINQVQKLPESASLKILDRLWDIIAARHKDLRAAFHGVRGARPPYPNLGDLDMTNVEDVERRFHQAAQHDEVDEVTFRLNERPGDQRVPSGPILPEDDFIKDLMNQVGFGQDVGDGQEISDDDNDAELAAKL